MAIDFSQIKAIAIPEGIAKKIEINGVTVWEGKLVDSITISGQTTSLDRNSSFSFGGTVTAHYSDGTTANVTSSATFSGYNMSVSGTYTVTVSYSESGITKTVSYTLTVNKIWETLWNGTLTLTQSGSTAHHVSGPSVSKSTGDYDFRITWESSTSGSTGTDTYYVKDVGTSSTKPSSPLTVTINTTQGSWKLLEVTREEQGNYHNGSTVYLGYYNDNAYASGNPHFDLVGSQLNNNPGIAQTVTLTITKIEKYY